jgi:hypothetical protein
MSIGCVIILLFLSFMLFSGGLVVSLNIILCSFLGILSSTVCMSFITFMMFLFVCFNTIFYLLLFWLFSLLGQFL